MDGCMRGLGRAKSPVEGAGEREGGGRLQLLAVRELGGLDGLADHEYL